MSNFIIPATKAANFFLILLLVIGCSPAKNATIKRTALTHVTVVDVVAGRLAADQTVVIEGERITEIGPASSVRLGNNASIIDARGKYLIPGLWDMHVHLELATKESLPYFIAYGITGVRDMGTNSFGLISQWRNEIEQGSQTGPHIVTPGPIIDGPFFVSELRVTVNSPAEARRAVDSLAGLGVDFIKVHQQISKEAYLALADQTAKHNMTFVGHKPASITTEEAIKAGQRSIEHLLSTPDLNDTTIAQLKQAGTYFTPNLLIIDKIARLNDASLRNDKRLDQISPVLKEHWKKQTEAWGENVDKTIEFMQGIMPDMQQKTASMQRAGVLLLAGTDVGVPYAYPGSGLHEELELLVAAGLSPLQALQTATINPARFFKQEHVFGIVGKDKRADLILLNANPLQDISNVKDINSVIFRGKITDRNGLDAILR